MSTIRGSPTADGTYKELIPNPMDGIHWTKVLTDDGTASTVYTTTLGIERIDTYIFNVPPGTTKITVHSKTNGVGSNPVGSKVQNVIYDGSILLRGVQTPVLGWIDVVDEFVGNFSGNIEIGISLLRDTTNSLNTTLVYIEFEFNHGSFIDTLVNDFGETVTLKRITNKVFDDYDEINESTSTYTETEIKAIIWRPTERRVIKIVGREFDADQAITIDSRIDISPTRNGVPDKILLRGQWYDVWNVIELTHPFTGTKRQAIMLKL